MLTSLHHWFVNPERDASLVLVPIGLTSIVIGLALLIATSAVYILGRNRIADILGRAFRLSPARLNAFLPSLISFK